MPLRITVLKETLNHLFGQIIYLGQPLSKIKEIISEKLHNCRRGRIEGEGPRSGMETQFPGTWISHISTRHNWVHKILSKWLQHKEVSRTTSAKMGFPVVSSSKGITSDHLRGRNEQTDCSCSVLSVELVRHYEESYYFISSRVWSGLSVSVCRGPGTASGNLLVQERRPNLLLSLILDSQMNCLGSGGWGTWGQS